LSGPSGKIDEAFEKVISKEAPDSRELRRLEKKLKAAGLSLREEKRYSKELEKKVAEAEKRVDLALALSTHESSKISFTPRRFSRSEAVAHIVHSDLHVGERVDPKRVNNTNRYDEEVAHESLNQLWDLSTNILKWRRTSP
jgi:hypothetical protein